MTSYCQYTPDKKEQSTQNQTKICAIIVFYVYFVLYIELLFGDVGLNGSLNNNRNIIWSSPNTLTLSVANSWVASDNFITLQPGKYILGFKAHTTCKSDIYIDVSIDTKESSFIFYEKNVNIPVSKITTDETGVVRSVTNVFVATIDAPIELHFLGYASSIIAITYELWALRII